MAIEIPAEWVKRVPKLFPNLVFQFTSKVDHNYNCLAWAVSCDTLYFENGKGCYWPWPDIPDDTADGWARVCEIHGFTPTDSTDFMAGYEKIAIFEDDDGVSHATRQDKNGKWKSKLGGWGPDIDHDELAPLESGYGKVVRVLQRNRPDWEAA